MTLTQAPKLLGETELTPANLKHNHFYLTRFLSRFPLDLIGGTNADEPAKRTALVDWGGPMPEETDIPSDKNMFRKRGWVREFFFSTDATPGDVVHVREISPYRYQVSLKKKARL